MEVITNGEKDVEKEIVFRKLKILKLDRLSSCKSFCCHNYNLKFPLLDEVNIRGCPKLKVFYPGDLTTPLLKGVEVEDSETYWQSNLNRTIQQLYNKKARIEILFFLILEFLVNHICRPMFVFDSIHVCPTIIDK